MHKQLLKDNEVSDIINKCYNADANHMLTVLFDAEHGLDNSIKRTINDFISYNIKLYSICINNNFIGYFGEESINQDKFLSGFFIMPEYRKIYKKEFWNMILDHFNGNFKVFMSDHNQRAKKFLEKNNCNLVNKFNNDKYGMMNLFEYKENT